MRQELPHRVKFQKSWDDGIVDFADSIVALAHLTDEAGRKKLRSNFHFIDPGLKAQTKVLLKKPFFEKAFLKIQKPREEIVDALIYLETPSAFELPQEVAGFIYTKNKFDISPPIDRNEDFRPRSKSHEFLEKVWWEIMNFRVSEYKPDWLKIPDSFEKFDETVASETVDLRNRFGFNFQQAITALVAGFWNDETDSPDLRRTGEETWVHSLRVFLRTAKEWIPRPNENTWWVIYTSYLASLLHDCQEEKAFFPNFSIKKDAEITKDINAYTLSFNKKDGNHEFSLFLSEDESEMLDIQLRAYTSPSDNPKVQFSFIEQNAASLVKRFKDPIGQYAALYLIRGKIEDRLDNLNTYWALGKKRKDQKFDLKTTYRKKIKETLFYFERLEEIAENLLLVQSQTEDQSHMAKYVLPFLESSVNFCYSVLLGATHDEIFDEPILDFYKSYGNAFSGTQKDKEEFIKNHYLFIVNPYILYNTTYLV